MIEWTLENRKLSELKPNESNPRRMSKKNADELKNSISSFGLCQPIVINQDNAIIGGHQRYQILKRMGKKSSDVFVPSRMLNDEEAKELIIRLNKNTGEFDIDMLANCWDVDLLLDSGFTEEELCITSVMDQEEEKPKKLKLVISLQDEEHLQMMEKTLKTIICDYPGATLTKR